MMDNFTPIREKMEETMSEPGIIGDEWFLTIAPG